MLRKIQKISSLVKLNKGGSLFLKKPYFVFSQKKDDKENEDDKEKKKRESLSEKLEKWNEALSQKTTASIAKLKTIDWKKLKNHKYLKYFLLGVGFGSAFLLFSHLTDDSTIIYNDLFGNYLPNNLVTHIKIRKTLQYTGYQTNAEIVLADGSIKRLEIGNLDDFLQKLAAAQEEGGKWGRGEEGTKGGGRREEEGGRRDGKREIGGWEQEKKRKVVVDMGMELGGLQFFDKYYEFFHMTVMVVSLYLFISILKRSDIMKGGGDVFGVGKSNARIFNPQTDIKVRFKDVAGLNEAKAEITEFVDFLKHPKKYMDLGAKLPRGALLSGPPGTGKTMLAKACAGEANVPFLYMSGSDFVEMFVGVGASRVRDLFKIAKEKAPSIIFIDEIDAVGRKRESKAGGNDERDNTLNQLLVEMDGFSTDTSVIVLAATNKPELLDAALTRPGRFDRTIEITLPDLVGRKDIFLVHLKNILLEGREEEGRKREEGRREEEGKRREEEGRRREEEGRRREEEGKRREEEGGKKEEEGEKKMEEGTRSEGGKREEGVKEERQRREGGILEKGKKVEVKKEEEISMVEEKYARRMAALTPGFSGAEISNLCNEAAILAAREKADSVNSRHFELASERLLAGLEKKSLITPEEKKIVSIHEAGHGTVSWFLPGGLPLLKITIIPRSKGSLGYAQYLPSESSLETKDELMDRICYILGGRCAEEVFFGKITTGASDDLQKVTELAYVLVSKLGMNKNIGLRGMKLEDYIKHMSEETLQEIDKEVRKIIKDATEKTKAIIIEHKDHIQKSLNN